MKQSPKFLVIKDPCNQNWINMEQSALGRHCQECMKTVVDFTNMSDAEIIHYLNQYKQICGRLRHDQLRRPLQTYSPSPTRTLLVRFITTLILLGKPEEMPAGEVRTEIRCVDSKKHDSMVVKQTITPLDSSTNLLWGYVFDRTANEKIGYATVRIKESRQHVVCDDEGRFSFMLPDSLIGKNLTLQAFYVGYQPAELITRATDLDKPRSIVILYPSSSIGIVDEEPVTSIRWWEFWKKRRPVKTN